jgi:hypothetical protein
MIQAEEFLKSPEQVLERNRSVLTEDEFRYYKRLQYFETGSYRSFSLTGKAPDL